MAVPQIDLNSLPGLDVATGIFGSVLESNALYDDTVVAIMVYVYETVPPDTLI